MIEGAFRVLDDFEAVDASTEAMKALELQPPEETAFATAALALRYGERGAKSGGHRPAPITAEQLIEARRPEDLGAQPVDHLPARAGERDARRPARPQRAGPAHADPAGRQHRPRREPEPGAVGAGRGDAQAQGLTGRGIRACARSLSTGGRPNAQAARCS